MILVCSKLGTFSVLIYIFILTQKLEIDGYVQNIYWIFDLIKKCSKNLETLILAFNCHQYTNILKESYQENPISLPKLKILNVINCEKIENCFKNIMMPNLKTAKIEHSTGKIAGSSYDSLSPWIQPICQFVKYLYVLYVSMFVFYTSYLSVSLFI